MHENLHSLVLLTVWKDHYLDTDVPISRESRDNTIEIVRCDGVVRHHKSSDPRDMLSE